MKRLAIARVLGPRRGESAHRRGATGDERAEHGGAHAAGHHGRYARYLAIVAMALGLLALNTSGALAFNPQPDPPGRDQSPVNRPIDRLPVGLRAALARLERDAARGPSRHAGTALGARSLRPFAIRPACACGGSGGGTNWSQQAALTASNGVSYDAFGYTVALSSNGYIALIGAIDANNKAGAAYVFVRSGSSWIQAQELTAPDGVSGDMFGRSVALNSTGGTLLVGAPAKNYGRGAVYVYGTLPYWGWGLQAELTASDGSVYDSFGVSAALSGDGNSALIGAYGKNNNRGAAYSFTRNGSAWSQQTELTAPDGAPNDEYGWSVALSSDGSTALIGAPWKNYYHGAAYMYGHSGAGWSQQPELSASDGATNDGFGSSVALNSNGATALIGAPGKNSGSGAAYVFVPFAGWDQAAELTATDGGRFGTAVALSSTGGTALIGGPASNGGTGAAYVFQGSWTTWPQTAELLASDGALHDAAGWSVALSGDGGTALVGAFNHNTQTGAAYIF